MSKRTVRPDDGKPLDEFQRAMLAVFAGWLILVFLGGCSLVFGGIKLSGLGGWQVPKLFENLGMFGDAFGAVTSLASALTLLIAYQVFQLQRTELRETKDALRAQQRGRLVFGAKTSGRRTSTGVGVVG